MDSSVNPDNVNPHFENPEAFGLKPEQSTINVAPGSFVPLQNGVCPSCGYCPSCGRPSNHYYGPWWGYYPYVTHTTTPPGTFTMTSGGYQIGGSSGGL